MNDPINDDNFNFTEQREAQLTAYALGELDEHERALVERRLEHDAEARAIVAQVRELATTLTAELAAEPMPRLSEPQREALRAEHPTRLIGVMKSRTVSLRTRLWFGAGLAAAACLAVAVTTSNLDNSTKQPGAGTLALGQPVPQVDAEGQLRDKFTGQESRASKLYAHGKVPNEEQMGLKRQAGRETKLDAADKFTSAQTAAGASPVPGASATEQLRAPLEVRKTENMTLGQPLEQFAGGDSPVATVAPAPVTPTSPPAPVVGQAPADDSLVYLKHADAGEVADQLNALLAEAGTGGPLAARDEGLTGGGIDSSPSQRAQAMTEAPTPATAPSGGPGGADATGVININTAPGSSVLNPSVVSAGRQPAGSSGGLWSTEVHAKFKSADEEHAERARRIPWLGDVPLLSPPFSGQPNSETYNRIVDNPFLAVTENPLSTFSIDVDTGSYANVRRFLLQDNTLPPPDAVRIEELINYFPLAAAAPGPESEHPFAVHMDMWEAPWSGDHHLARVTIKGREVKMDQRPATSLVFLIDVSGSMQPTNKLPLLKQSMKMLVDQLHGDDRLAIVTYAGASGLALPSTFASDKQRILGAIDNLNAGGSTNGAAGIQLAYQVAAESFIPAGVNRVILATDGDFNVGVSDDASLIRLIEEKRGTGVHLSVLGFGDGNLKDAKMEQLANHGNGEYAYIDSAREGRKVLVEQAAGTLITIAKDVKIQIEFNPATVASYRLIGYENRVLAKEDFNNDAKDAGEIGAGHCVTALYEIVSANADVAGAPAVDALKYQKPAVQPTDAAKNSGELMTIKLRYKQPDGQVSKLIEMPVPDMRGRLGRVPDDMRFLTAVAEFGMLLRNSPYKGNASFAQVLDLAEGSRGEDAGGYRAEFIELVNRARALRGQ